MMRIGVLGRGRFGSHLAHSLNALGYPVQVRHHRDDTSLATWIEANELLCLACRDDQLPALVSELAAFALGSKTLMIHSGATPLALLAPLAARGARVGKFHPLMAFTQVAEAPIPIGTPFAYEGEIEALIRPWAEAWGCKLYPLAGAQWQTYHLAAVVAANFLPLFIREGARLLAPLTPGQTEAESLDWLAPLVRTTLEAGLDGTNLLPFSGPAVRGDHKVLRAQEALLDQHDPAWSELYRQISAMIQARTKPTNR